MYVPNGEPLDTAVVVEAAPADHSAALVNYFLTRHVKSTHYDVRGIAHYEYTQVKDLPVASQQLSIVNGIDAMEQGFVWTRILADHINVGSDLLVNVRSWLATVSIDTQTEFNSQVEGVFRETGFSDMYFNVYIPSRAIIVDIYKQYINNVSTRSDAIGIETGNNIIEVLEKLKREKHYTTSMLKQALRNYPVQESPDAPLDSYAKAVARLMAIQNKWCGVTMPANEYAGRNDYMEDLESDESALYVDLNLPFAKSYSAAMIKEFGMDIDVFIAKLSSLNTETQRFSGSLSEERIIETIVHLLKNSNFVANGNLSDSPNRCPVHRHAPNDLGKLIAPNVSRNMNALLAEALASMQGRFD